MKTIKDYNPVFVDFPKNKPLLTSQKAQLILYYLGTFFTKHSKRDIFKIYNNHDSYYWDENNHLIFETEFIYDRNFTDCLKSNYSSREDIDYEKVRKNKVKYHDGVYLSYNFTTNEISIQGYLIDNEHGRYRGDNILIEDIKSFTDSDLEWLLSLDMIDYNIREQQINNFFDEIKKKFPSGRFYNYHTSSYSKSSTDIGYLEKVECIFDKQTVILHMHEFSLETEKLSDDKNSVHKLSIDFLRKGEDIKTYNIKLLRDMTVKKKIYETRKDKIEQIKIKCQRDEQEIRNKTEWIEKAKNTIENLKKNIVENNISIEQKKKELENTNIKDIKLL